jgi:uncharacterized membrane protein
MAERLSRDTNKSPALAQIIDRNIEALLTRRQQEEREKGMQQRLADIITRFTGSMIFVYIHLALFGLWIFINLGWLSWLGLPRFDPTLVILAMAASVEAIFLSTFILISQNRMMALADKRADLDLHISLLSEHEITRLLNLVAAVAERMGIEESQDPELTELGRDIKPEHVLDRMEEHEDIQAETPSTSP